VFLKEDRSVVEGGPESRVNATIYPEKIRTLINKRCFKLLFFKPDFKNIGLLIC